MKSKRSRSGGVRNPKRNAVLFGLITVASIVLIALGVADMRATGRTSSPLLMVGLFPAILCPIFFVHYMRTLRVFRDMQSGRIAIARWTLSAEQFTRFCEEDERLAARRITTNFYKPPKAIPADGVDVIFSNDGVLIGGGYFPLSTTRGRRVRSVRYNSSSPPSIEFGTVLSSMVRTSSATIGTVGSVENLRVPVSADAAMQAVEVVYRYEGMIDGR